MDLISKHSWGVFWSAWSKWRRKTNTVEILEGLTSADEGSVELLGEHWNAGNDQSLRERIGVQLQETQLAEKGDRGRDLEALSQFLQTRS